MARVEQNKEYLCCETPYCNYLKKINTDVLIFCLNIILMLCAIILFMKVWFSHVWQNRNVIKVLTLSEMKAEYSNTFFGFMWLILKPAFMVLAIVATFYFRAGEIELASYALTVTYGVVIWNVMSGIMSQMVELIYSQKNAFLKTTLPREVISLLPISRIFVDFIFGFIFIILAHIFLFQAPNMMTLPFLLIGACLGVVITYGLGLILAILAVYFRDLRYFVVQMMRILFFVTPIFLLELPEGILTKTLYFNPFSIAIIVGRAGEYPQDDVWFLVGILVTWAIGSLIAGTYFYKKRVYDAVDIV